MNGVGWDGGTGQKGVSQGVAGVPEETGVPTVPYRSTVPPGLWILYLATATVLIHDGIVAQQWWLLMVTVLDVVGMTIVLVWPERRGA